MTPKKTFSGLTLIEVMTGVAILSVVAIAVVPSILSTRKASEANAYQSSILTAVTSFTEKTKAISFSELEDPADGVTTAIEYVISSDSNATLTNDVESVLEVPIDADPDGTTTIICDLSIRISRIVGMDAVQLDILYGYQIPLTDRTYLSSISSIISSVPTF